MTNLASLIDWFESKGRVLVALSGGVDSALVAYAAFQKLRDSAMAVTADYKTLSGEELETSKVICSEIGIKQILINYNELENENFVTNDKNRCFYCRSELSQHLIKLSDKYKITTIVDGTHLDDLGEYRPGIRALRESKIRSPLAETNFTKKDIRQEAQKAGISIYNKPSNSCLASRIPWGQRVTAEKLTRIELGEIFVKNKTNARQVRVRDMNGTAKIEVDLENLPNLFDKKTFNELDSQLRLIGFKSTMIDPQGYSPGKINVV